MIGTQIGNFRILEKLGEGGMGVVYKAVDIHLDRPVAIKALNTQLAEHPELEARFRAEAKAQANLNHNNLATLYTLLVEEGRPWLVMEFIEGESLEQMVRGRGAIPACEAIPLFRQALDGIGCAHRMGIVHRAIKPSNLMLNKQGIVKVMDFGIAKVIGSRGMTRTGTQMGTAFYMSPEQVLNRGADTRSDIYSLGVTLYEILTANVPFNGDSDYQVMTDHVSTPPPLPTKFNAAIPQGVQNAVMKALEKNPDARFQTTEEFARALEKPDSFGVTPVEVIPAAAILVTAANAAVAEIPAPVVVKASFWSPERRTAAGAAAILLTGAASYAALRPEPVAPAPSAEPPPVPEAAPASAIVIPAGTPITIRMVDNVNSGRDRTDQRFEASVDAPVIVDGRTVVAPGARARVVLTNLGTEVKLELVSLSIDGAAHPVRSSLYKKLAPPHGKAKGGAVAKGAAIGGIFGRGKGAAAGAAAGGGAVAISEIAAQGHAIVPSETRITFTLRSLIQ